MPACAFDKLVGRCTPPPKRTPLRVFVDTDDVVGVAHEQFEFRCTELRDVVGFIHQERIYVAIVLRCSRIGYELILTGHVPLHRTDR